MAPNHTELSARKKKIDASEILITRLYNRNIFRIYSVSAVQDLNNAAKHSVSVSCSVWLFIHVDDDHRKLNELIQCLILTQDCFLHRDITGFPLSFVFFKMHGRFYRTVSTLVSSFVFHTRSLCFPPTGHSFSQ